MARSLTPTRNRSIEGVGLSRDRMLDGAKARIPDGTTIVSADNHWGLAEDPWKGRVPAAFKDRVPTIWWDDTIGMWNCYTRSAIEDIVDRVSPGDARKILGETAIEVFDLPAPASFAR